MSSSLGRPVEDGDEVDVAVGAQARHDRQARRRGGAARDLAALDRIVGVGGFAQVAQEGEQVALVQQRDVDFHGAGEEIDVGRLAGDRGNRALFCDRVAQVEQLARVADARHRVGPLQALLVADDAQLLEPPVDRDFLVDLLFLLGDARELLARLLALGARGAELLLGLLLLGLQPVNQAAACGQQPDQDRQRRGELFQLGGGEVHFSARPTVMVKRGASLPSAEPMSPDSVPSEVTSKGSCVRRMRHDGSVRSASAKRCSCPVMARYSERWIAVTCPDTSSICIMSTVAAAPAGGAAALGCAAARSSAAVAFSSLPTRHSTASISICGNLSTTCDRYTSAGSGDADCAAMRVNSTTVAFRLSVVVWVTGKEAVMRSYCWVAVCASRRSSPIWSLTPNRSIHCAPAYSRQAAKPATPAPTIARCSRQSTKLRRSSWRANCSLGGLRTARRRNRSSPAASARSRLMPTLRAASSIGTVWKASRASETSACSKVARCTAGVTTITWMGGPSRGSARSVDRYCTRRSVSARTNAASASGGISAVRSRRAKRQRPTSL